MASIRESGDGALSRRSIVWLSISSCFVGDGVFIVLPWHNAVAHWPRACDRSMCSRSLGGSFAFSSPGLEGKHRIKRGLAHLL